MIEKRLAKLLLEIINRRPRNFTGIGIVATPRPRTLPLSSLTPVGSNLALPIRNYDEILHFLLSISIQSSIYHDGFHIISHPFNLVCVSQYFSTPIVKDADAEFGFGSRYRTALYGSFIENVDAVGVISHKFEAAIFIKGKRYNPAFIV
jgi:hypothetical protein